MNLIKNNNQFVTDILFAKEIVKTLEDTVFEYYPKNCFDILPLLHKEYDNLSFVLYRLEKYNQSNNQK